MLNEERMYKEKQQTCIRAYKKGFFTIVKWLSWRIQHEYLRQRE